MFSPATEDVKCSNLSHPILHSDSNGAFMGVDAAITLWSTCGPVQEYGFLSRTRGLPVPLSLWQLSIRPPLAIQGPVKDYDLLRVQHAAQRRVKIPMRWVLWTLLVGGGAGVVSLFLCVLQFHVK